MRTYLVFLCLLVSTLALSQRYRDSILVDKGPWGVYRDGVFVYDGDTLQTKKQFVDSLTGCLDAYSDNLVIVNGKWVYYKGPGNTTYPKGKRYEIDPAYIRANLRRKINRWIREKRLA